MVFIYPLTFVFVGLFIISSVISLIKVANGKIVCTIGKKKEQVKRNSIIVFLALFFTFVCIILSSEHAIIISHFFYYIIIGLGWDTR